MDLQSAIDLYLNRDRLHEHVRTASHAEKVATLRQVRQYVADQRLTRDNAVASAEASVPAARKAMEAADEAARQALAAYNETVGRINRWKQAFELTAAVLELRVDEYHTPHEIAAADAPEAAAAPATAAA
jgi:hypothetical protein